LFGEQGVLGSQLQPKEANQGWGTRFLQAMVHRELMMKHEGLNEVEWDLFISAVDTLPSWRVQQE
jgi:hypothetical protein